ncbi:hypothetical protein ACVDG5_034800 [Mesorhizobium sp. ORM6]
MIQFLRDLIAAAPYVIHAVLTDKGIHFAKRSCDRQSSVKKAISRRP